ncbi:MAG TPA: hypothetical protein PK096_01350 [Candidatus Saccharibacteria bacterium]|nr:hypothetical protein [Candidatus Saccharibacteria bacterium]HRK93995.1 hypothetical protein [Candidatus Saccharibacteria bacterium]
MNKKRLFAFICLIAAAIIGFVVLYRYIDSVPVSFTATNIQKITVKNADGAVLHESSDPSAFSVRIPKQTTIEVGFVGREGYETSSRNERIGNKPKTVSIKPYYSTSRLARLSANEQGALTAALQKAYSPVIAQYSLSDFKLYHFGEWASVTLRRADTQASRTDSYRVILKKESGAWSVETSPALLFYENSHKTVPVDILRQVNYS